ncbi:MAG: DUF3048 C-terminal domain-containing protein [Clostridia bacterium]|nr:DUF3048 C-terminal domain-containing protein [Clostridia bacterium]
MNSFSVKKFLGAFFLASCALFSACGSEEPVGTDSPETVYGTTGGTLASTQENTDPDNNGTSAVTGTTPAYHAVTWSLGSEVEASEKNEYSLPEPEEIYAEQDIYYNYLSGFETDETDTLGIRRVTAVCLNNTYKGSRFQCGTSEADVIFEIPMDYDVTGLVALYYHPSNIAKLGPVRSAYPAAVSVAEAYDAYLLHNGTIGGGSSVINEYDTSHLDVENDGVYDCFYADSAISGAVGYAYSMFTTSGRIVKSLAMLCSDGSHFITDEIYRTPFAFNDEFVTPIGNSAKRIRTVYGGFQPYFLYNSNTGLYERYQHGAPHVDVNTGETLAFENVIILFADSDYYNYHLGYNIEGFGSGIYASGGKYVNISWSKASEESPIVFFDALGNVLKLNKGHTFVSVTGGMSAVEIK